MDRLQLLGLGAQVGRVVPSNVIPTSVYAVTADYGEIAPQWRVVFSVSYWESRLTDGVVQTFVDTLQRSLIDPTHQAQIAPSRVLVYDVAFGGAMRWSPAGAVVLRPYLEGGLAAHVIVAEGKLISGTFVENAMNQIAAGFIGGAGLELHPPGRISLEAALRGDLLSGFRSVQVRAGGAYYFGPPGTAHS